MDVVLLQGIVWVLLFLQIVLESLPISSSSHTLLAQRFLPVQLSGRSFGILDFFAHGPTILIVAIFFWSEWSRLLIRLVTRKSKVLFSLFLKIVGLVFVVECITAVFYGIIKVVLKGWWVLQSNGVLWTGLALTAAGLLSLRAIKTKPDRYESFNLHKAIILGVVQGFALLPGISRLGSTYVVGRWLNLSPRRAFQISFLIHIPLMGAAFLGSLAKLFLMKKPDVLLVKQAIFSWQGSVVLIAATICGYLAIWFAWRWAMEEKFWRFGVYVLGLLGGLILLSP